MEAAAAAGPALRTVLVITVERPVWPVAGSVRAVTVRSGRNAVIVAGPDTPVLFVSSRSVTWLSASATTRT